MKQNEKQTVKYPSARTKAMEGFMEFARQPEWKPERIDVGLITQMGISPSKEALTVSTLRFLGFIDESGILTNEFEALRKDYKATLKALVLEKYAGLLKVIPTALANQKRLVSFFCSAGTAIDTAEYQTALFVWFCREAGIDLPNVKGGVHRARFDKEKATHVA